MKVNGNGGGGDYENPPVGTTFGRIRGIFDCGTQPAKNPGEAASPTICWWFELTGQKVKDSKGKNFLAAKFMKTSNNSNGNLMKWYMALTGETFTGRPGASGTTWYDLPEDFNARLKKLVGSPVMITIAASTKGDGKVVVDNVAQIPEGFPVAELTEATAWLDMDDHKEFASDWSACPDWIKKFVSKCQEMAGKPAPTLNTAGTQNQAVPAGAVGTATFEDDIPW